jgi:hypothetical protein
MLEAARMLADECRWQAQRINHSVGEDETLALIDQIADWD